MFSKDYEGLLLIDVQNTCTEKEYEIPEWGLTLKKCREKVEQIESLVNIFRQKDLPIIHITTTEWKKEHLEWNIQKLYDENPDAKFYHSGLPQGLINRLPGEYHFRKNMPSAFGGTDYLERSLSDLFDEKGWKHFAIAGFFSTGCVHETIIEGFNRNKLFWYIVRDCTETFDSEKKQLLQKMLFEEHFFCMNGHVVNMADCM